MASPISVVIPSYNGAGFIGAALESIAAQTLPPQEIVVVDDCSQDSTAEIVQGFSRRCSVPIRLLRLATNSGGPTKPMNEGVRESTTPLVAILDQDDLMAPTRLASQVRALEAHSEVPAVIGLLRKIDAIDQPRSPEFAEEFRRRILSIEHTAACGCHLLDSPGLYRHVLAHGTLTVGSNTAFRRDVWTAIGGFHRELRVAWVLDFCCKLATRGSVAFVDEVVGAYRVHGGNTSARETSVRENCWR